MPIEIKLLKNIVNTKDMTLGKHTIELLKMYKSMTAQVCRAENSIVSSLSRRGSLYFFL